MKKEHAITTTRRTLIVSILCFFFLAILAAILFVGYFFIKKDMPWWKRCLSFSTSLPFIMGSHFLWLDNPGIWPCMLFWFIAIANYCFCQSKIWRQNKWPCGVMLIGMLGNAVATLANGGYMPVLGKSESTSLWVPLTETSRVTWLCDIYAGCSLGDLCIGIGLLGVLLSWAYEKITAPILEPFQDKGGLSL